MCSFQGYAAFNDTPELVQDQTKNILSGKEDKGINLLTAKA